MPLAKFFWLDEWVSWLGGGSRAVVVTPREWMRHTATTRAGGTTRSTGRVGGRVGYPAEEAALVAVFMEVF